MQEQDLDLEKEKTAHSLENLQIDVDRFYTEMAGLEVKLDLTIVPDVMYINTKMVAIREASQRAQRMYLKIQRAIGISQKWLLNLETSCDILVNSKLENDVDVRAGQTGDERKAIASNQLVGYKRAIREAKNNVNLLKALNKAIDLCIKNLDRTDGDVKQQSRLMEAQMRNLKSRDVGDAARDTFLRRTESDMDELEKLSEELNSSPSSTVLVGSDDTLEPTVPAEEVVEEEEEDATEEPATVPGAPVAEETVVQPVGAMMGDDDDDLVVSSSAVPVVATLIDDDDDVTVSPGITGAPALATEGTEGDLINFLGSIPEVSSRKDAGVVTPASTDLDGGADDTTTYSDDIFGSVLDMGDDASDTGDTTVVSVDDGDVFGGLVESSTVTEQKVPKLVKDELQREAAAKAAPTKATAAKAAATPAPAPTPSAAPVAPATKAAEDDNLDKLMSDLGL